MADETAKSVKEIAELLRQHADQEDAVVALAVERSKRMAEMSPEMPDRLDNIQANIGGFRLEDRQFRQNLLSELERHNVLLSEIIEKLGKAEIP